MKRSSGSGGVGGSCAGGSGSSVNPKHKPRQYVQVPDDKMAAGYVFEKNAHADIASNYKKNSFVIFRVLTPKQCDELILWIWANVILKQPWKDGVKIVLYGKDDRELDASLEADKAEVLEQVKGPLSVERRKMFEEGWPLHRGFGASCDPQVFHHQLLWNVREDRDVYRVATLILETLELLVTLERHIEKLPGQGDNEFWHFDSDVKQRLLDIKANVDVEASVAGKLMYTDSSFKVLKGSHTAEWLLEFEENYKDIYATKFSKHTAKFGLDDGADDPMNLTDETDKTYLVPAGCIVMFSPDALHGTSKNSIYGWTEYGHYQGYRPAKLNAEREAKYLALAGIGEMEDRLRSYDEGMAPILWPSLDKIHFYPNRFNNMTQLMNAYLNKLPDGHAMRGTRAGAGVNCDKTYDILLTPGNQGYVAPALTLFGEHLLGKKPWPNAAEGAAEAVVAVQAPAAAELGDTESDSDAENAVQAVVAVAAPAPDVVLIIDSESDEDLFAPAPTKKQRGLGGSA